MVKLLSRMNKSLLIALFSFISYFSFSQINPGIPTFPTTNRIKFGYQTEAKGLIWITNQAPGASPGYDYTPSTNLDYFFILNSSTGILYNYRDGAWKQLGLNLSDASISGILPVARGGTNVGSLTANGILYASATDQVATSGNLTFDGTNFATTGTASATKLIPTGGSATGNGMYLPATNTVGFSTNGVERMRINASGNLGLGVTPSAWSGRRAFESTYGGALSFDGVFLQTAVSSNCYYDGTNWIYKLTNWGATRYETGDITNGAPFHRWYTAPSGTAGNAITFTQAMTLGTNNGLSIGTTTTAPANGLLVAGAATFSSSVTANTLSLTTPLSVANGGTGQSTLAAAGIVTGTGTTNYLPKFTGTSTIGNSVIHESAGSNIGIGNTNNTYKLDVTGNIRSSETVLVGNGASQTELRINSLGGNNQGPFIRLQKEGSTKGYIGTYSAIINGTSDDLTYYAMGSQQWMTNNSTNTKMLLDASGNLGLGNDNPTSRLVVKGIGTNDVNTSAFNVTNSSDNSMFFVRNDGNVGIGVLNPATRLTVKSSSNTSTGGFAVESSDSNDRLFIYSGTNEWIISPSYSSGGALKPLVFQSAVDGANNMYFAVNGNVGINNSDPQSRLHVKQLSNDHTGGLKLERSSNTNTYSLNVDGSNNLNLGYAATASNSPTNRLVIDANGNVGIGTPSPSNLFHLYGTDGYSYMRWTSNVATTGTRIGYNGTEFRIDQQQNGDITFRTSGNERMRITSGGNVNIVGSSGQLNHYVYNTTVFGALNTWYRVAQINRIENYFINLSISTSAAGTVFNVVNINISGSSIEAKWRASNNQYAIQAVRIATDGNTTYLEVLSNNTTPIVSITSSYIKGINFTPLDFTSASGSTGLNTFTFSEYGSANAGSFTGVITNHNYNFIANGTERMRITGEGHVNIGGNYTQTTNTLNVTGTAFFSGQVTSGTGFLINSGQYSSISTIPYAGFFLSNAAFADGFGSLFITSRNDASRPIIFGTSSGSVLTERMRIDGTGNVGIGTTTPQNRLDVEGAVAIGAGYSGSAPAAPTNGLIVEGSVGIGTNNPTSGTKLHVVGTIEYDSRPAAGTATALGVDANGIVKEISASSIRFKENIVDYNKGLSETLKLTPKTYNYIGENIKQAGLIAEELDELGFTEYIVYDKDNKPYSLQYSNMVVLLINSIKEQQAIIEDLKARIIKLENK